MNISHINTYQQYVAEDEQDSCVMSGKHKRPPLRDLIYRKLEFKLPMREGYFLKDTERKQLDIINIYINYTTESATLNKLY